MNWVWVLQIGGTVVEVELLWCRLIAVEDHGCGDVDWVGFVTVIDEMVELW